MVSSITSFWHRFYWQDPRRIWATRFGKMIPAAFLTTHRSRDPTIDLIVCLYAVVP
jgi:hypothetical protein